MGAYPATNPEAPVSLRKIAIEEHVLGRVHDHADPTPEFWKAVLKRIGGDSALLDEMDASGIEVQVLSPSVPAHVRETAPADTRRINDFMADRTRMSDGRLEAFAAVPLQDTDAAIVEVQRAVTELGMRGVLARACGQFTDDARPHYLDEDRFDPFWEALAELRMPLYLRSDNLTPQRASDVAAHALRLIYGRVFDRHPAANLILGHMGAMIPVIARRLRAFDNRPDGVHPARRIQDHLAANVYVTTGDLDDQALVTAVLAVGADRVLFTVGYPYDDAVRRIDGAPIVEADRRKIARDNAVRLLGLTDTMPVE